MMNTANGYMEKYAERGEITIRIRHVLSCIYYGICFMIMMSTRDGNSIIPGMQRMMIHHPKSAK